MEKKQKYELMIIFELNYSESDLQTEVDAVKKYLEANVEGLKENVMGRRPFAYVINKKKFGHYVVYNFTAAPNFVFNDLESKLKLNESVIRHMVRNLDRAKFISISSSGELVQVNYKNVDLLYQFLSEYNKVLPRKVTNMKEKEQKRITKEIKIARNMALLPFTTECIEK